jgi:hypothetical protein
VESLEIKATDPAVERFFIPRVLEKLREKHGANYKIETRQNLLKAIKITGLNQEQLKELKSPLAWTLKKASQRKKTSAPQPTS